MATPSPHTLWTRTATAMVKDMFKKQRFLTTRDIWDEGTEGSRPVAQQTQMIDQHGRIRMKRVSNMREGRRIWVPPPATPMPHHPFQAMRFLKYNILGGLEASNLIHKVKVHVPITEAEEVLEAERAAMRTFRRRVFDANKLGLPAPTRPPVPRTHKPEYFWTLGPAPTRPRTFGEADLGTPLTAEEVEQIDDAAWSRIEAMEKTYHEEQALERELVAARKALRAANFKAERERARAEREELLEAGHGPRMAHERRRSRAIQSVQEYADITGEDVTDWLQELEGASLPTEEYPERFEAAVNPTRVDGKLRLTPDVPRRNPKKAQFGLRRET